MRGLMADLGMKRQPRVAAVAGLAARLASQENAQEDSQEDDPQDEERKDRRKDRKDRKDKKDRKDRKRKGGPSVPRGTPRKKRQPVDAVPPPDSTAGPNYPGGLSDAFWQLRINQLLRKESAPVVAPRIDATLLDDGMSDRKKKKQQLVLSATSDQINPTNELDQPPVEEKPGSAAPSDPACHSGALDEPSVDVKPTIKREIPDEVDILIVGEHRDGVVLGAAHMRRERQAAVGFYL